MTISYVGYASSNASTITSPSGISAGDLIVLFDWAVAGSLPAYVIPEGFTEIADLSTGGYRGIISYKVSDGSDSSQSFTGMSGTAANKKMAVFGSDFDNISIGGVNTQITGGVPEPQTIPSGSVTPPVLCLAFYGIYLIGSIDPRGFDPSGTELGGTNQYIVYKIYNSSPSDILVSMADESYVNLLASCYVQQVGGSGGGASILIGL
jgi:hypothetical protein